MIGIKNMKMPHDCYECNFLDIDSTILETEYYCLAADDKKIENNIDENCRAEICPLFNIYKKENKENKDNKEFHWHESRGLNIVDDDNIYETFSETRTAIGTNTPIIHSYQSAFFSQDTIRKGYKLFAHFANGKTEEVFNGRITTTGKEVLPRHNLEGMLLAGSFGDLSWVIKKK